MAKKWLDFFGIINNEDEHGAVIRSLLDERLIRVKRGNYRKNTNGVLQFLEGCEIMIIRGPT